MVSGSCSEAVQSELAAYTSAPRDTVSTSDLQVRGANSRLPVAMVDCRPWAGVQRTARAKEGADVHPLRPGKPSISFGVPSPHLWASLQVLKNRRRDSGRPGAELLLPLVAVGLVHGPLHMVLVPSPPLFFTTCSGLLGKAKLSALLFVRSAKYPHLKGYRDALPKRCPMA